MTRTRRTIALGVVCWCAVVACGGGGGPSRAEAVAAITTDAVPARFDVFASDAQKLAVDAASWCAGANGVVLGDQVEATRRSWVSLSPFWFGPVAERRSRFIIDPTTTADRVRQILAGSDPLDAGALRNLYGADQRGLAAIDQLIELVDLGGGETPSDRACDYAVASAGLVADEAAALAGEWRLAGAAFGADDQAANGAVESMVNEVLFGLVTLASDPDVAAAKARLAGMRWTMLGDETASPGNVAGLAPLLDDGVVEQLTVEFDAAANLNGDALMELERTITTNVVSSLGLSVQFSDADGDG